jgi:hypothetical protein
MLVVAGGMTWPMARWLEYHAVGMAAGIPLVVAAFCAGLALPQPFWSTLVRVDQAGLTLWRRGLLSRPVRIERTAIRDARVRSARPSREERCRTSFLEVRLKSGKRELFGPWGALVTKAGINRRLARVVEELNVVVAGGSTRS